MPTNISYEQLRSHGDGVWIVSTNDINLISTDKESRSFVHSQSIHLGAETAALHILGEPDSPGIFINTKDGGQIVINGATGGLSHSMIRLHDGTLQLLGGSNAAPTSVVLGSSYFEVASGVQLTPLTHAKLSVESNGISLKHALNSIDMETGKIVFKSGPASLSLSPTGIELELGVNKFEISATKVLMKSAESEIELSPMAMKVNAPIAEFTINMSKKKSLIVKDAVDAILNDSVGLRMLDI